MGQFGMDEENEAEKKVETVEELKPPEIYDANIRNCGWSVGCVL